MKETDNLEEIKGGDEKGEQRKEGKGERGGK